MQVDLSGRVVLVTGASGGLGAHFAQVLAKNGAHVVMAARRRAALEAGAMGTSISGAGPSVFAWCESRDAAQDVANRMCAAFADAGFASDVHLTPINGPAAEVLA